jgi:RNA polymerase sigma factor (sigma-70 family)
VEGAVAPEADVTRGLYEQYANQIFRYCLHQLGSREEAEDAVQSTFLNAFRGIKRGVVPELESAWLFKIAHNVCLSRRRSAWRRGRVESPADFEVVEELTPAPSRRSDELIGLQDVLEQMPEAQRRAILLREWQGLSYREIAQELELSQAAVETLIFRARRSLANGLEQPLESKRRQIARAFDWGNVIAGIKSLLVGGSVAAKVAATVAVVSATTVVAAEPVQRHHRQHVAPAPQAERVVKHRTTAKAQPAAPVSQAPATHVASTPVRTSPKRAHASRRLTTPAQAVPPSPAPEPAVTVVPSAEQPVPVAPTAPPQAAPAEAQPAQPAEEPAAQDGAQAKGEEKAAKKLDKGSAQPSPDDRSQPTDPGKTDPGKTDPGTADQGKDDKHGLRITSVVPLQPDPVANQPQPVAAPDQAAPAPAPQAPPVQITSAPSVTQLRPDASEVTPDKS